MDRLKTIKDIYGKELELIPAAPTEIERGGIIATTVDDTTNMEEVVVGKDGKGYVSNKNVVENSKQIQQNKDDISTLMANVGNLSNTLADGIICSASGESIHIKDASDKKFVSQKLYGKSKQIMTTGAQLLNVKANEYFFKATYAAFKFAVSKGSIFTFPNGSDNLKSGNTRFLVYKLSVEEGKTYTISGSSKGTSVLATLSRYPKNAQDLGERESMIFNPINGSYTFTAEDKDYMIEFRTPSTSEGGVSTDSTIITLMLNEGETTLPWEPYTGGQASPNPDYPQEIESSGNSGYIEEVIMGEQLLDIHDCTISEKNMKNSVIDINEDSLVTISFVADTATEGGHARPHLIIDITDITNMDEIYVVSLDSLQANYVTQAEIRKENNKRILYILWGKSSAQGGYPVTGTGITAKFRIMLNKGDVAFSWEPYKSQQIYLSTPNGLHGIPVSSGGNYTDENGQQWVCDVECCEQSGQIGKLQRIGMYTFDGTEGGQMYTSGKFYVNIDVLTSGVKVSQLMMPTMMCTHAPVYTWDNSVNAKPMSEIFTTFGSTGYGPYTFALRIPGLTTAEEYTEYFGREYDAGTPVTVLYELANPVFTPYPDELQTEIRKLHTFKPITNITTDSGAGIGIEYVADTKTYIDNKFKELATAIIAGGES